MGRRLAVTHRSRMSAGLSITELQRQVRNLTAAKGFDITLEQRLAYLMAEVGEVASEVLKLSRDGNHDVGKMDSTETEVVVENVGMEIYDVVWNLLDLAEILGVDLEETFDKKARLNEDREW